MRVAPVLGTVLAFVALLTATACSKGGGGTCATSALGCTCQNEPFQLSAGWSPSKTCEAPKPTVAGAQSTCCYDLDSAGETTTCRCFSAACRKTRGGDFCGCSSVQIIDGDYDQVAECVKTPTTTCCKSGSQCICTAKPSCTGSEAQVDRCTPSDVRFDPCRAPGPGRAESCNGLKWKKAS